MMGELKGNPSQKTKVEQKKNEVYIRIKLYHPPENENIAWISTIELSPPKFNGRVKYGIGGYDDEHSFDELKKDLIIKGEKGQRYRYLIKKGQTLILFVVNKETGQKQNFGLNVSRDWPVYSKIGDSFERWSEYIKITTYLEKIGIF